MRKYIWIALIAAVGLAGCSSTPTTEAPVDDRSATALTRVNAASSFMMPSRFGRPFLDRAVGKERNPTRTACPRNCPRHR